MVRQVSAEGVRGLSAWNGGWRAHEARDVTASYGYCGSVSPQYSQLRSLTICTLTTHHSPARPYDSVSSRGGEGSSACFK